MLADLDTEVVGGGIAAALLLAYLFHLAGDPTDKVARPGGWLTRREVEEREGLRRGPIAAIRNWARVRRELRASQRRAKALARITLSSPDSFGGVQPEKPWPRR